MKSLLETSILCQKVAYLDSYAHITTLTLRKPASTNFQASLECLDVVIYEVSPSLELKQQPIPS